MVGEATRRRRGREVRHRREHQVHPPRSHPKADTQVTNLNNASSTNCHPSLPTTTNIREKSGSRRSRFFFFLPTSFPASSKPIQRLPWIPSCTWPSTSPPRRGPRWCVSCPLWRRQPPPSRERGLSLPAWLKAHSPGCKPQPKGAWLSPTCSWLESEARGANVRARGSCQVTDESLAMILTMSLDDWHRF